MLSRVADRRVWRCVFAAFAVVAAVLAVAVVPAARAADDKPTVDLKKDQKTSVSVGDATTAATYQLGNATVTGGASSYITVQVDSGYFTPNVDAPTGAEAAGALNESGGYVDGAKKGSKCMYASFKSPDGGASVSATAVQGYLRGLTFTLDGDKAQTVTVNVVDQPLKASYNGKEYDTTLFDGNAYTFISDTAIYWDKAYAVAKAATFFGTNGHLLTIESQSEHNLIYKSFGNKPGFMGATRFTSAAHAGDNPDTFSVTSDGQSDWGKAWYWVTGPSAGKKFWNGAVSAGGSAVAGVYQNWNSGEPNSSNNKEGCAEYGRGNAGQWNDVANDGTYGEGIRHVDGFYVEFEDVNLDKAGTTVSATTQRVNVSYDLDDGKATSNTAAGKVLTNDGDYSTTLGAVEGRTLDASSVKVTVGNKALTVNTDCTFDSSTGALKIFADKVTGDVVVSAKVMRQVTFNVGDGGTTEVPSSLSVSYGGKVSSATGFKQPDVTANARKKFTGWLSSVGGVDGQMYDPAKVGDVEVTSDMAFTAQYKDLVTVTFDYNGGRDKDGRESVSLSGVKNEDECEIPDKADLSFAGYTFVQWSPTPSGTYGASDETFTAQWTPNTDTKYTVEHYLQNVDDDSYPADPEATDSKTGTTDTETAAEAKSYTGFTAKEFSQEKIAGDGTTVVEIYYTRDKHDVTFDAKGHGTTPDKQEAVKYGAKVKNPGDLSQTGYTFGGWYKDESFADDKKWDFDTSTMPTENLTLYAKWDANPYTVAFDANGGEGSMPVQSFTYDTAQALSGNLFTRTGYTFRGWTLSRDGSGVLYADGESVMNLIDQSSGVRAARLLLADADADVTLYAQWKGNGYDITYDPAGGTLPDSVPKTHTYGEEMKLPIPTRDGYTFDGWYDEAGNKVDSIPADAKDLKITAKWTKDTDTDNGGATYDPNGGTIPDGWTGADGKLPVPTRPGYQFDGWYDNEGNLVTSLKDAAGKTLHARWTKLNALASTGVTSLAAGLTALALVAAGVTIGVLRRRCSR